MKLLIVLLGLPFAFGYEEMYQGFSDCGLDGWSCNYVKGKQEVTYTCPSHQPNARIWVWTARLPSGSTIFTVKNCNHLEIHMDCTKGLRTTVLRQFNVINVTYLEILPPLLPGVFLHDNDQVPQAPPVFHIENVRKTKFFPGLFEKPGGSCRFKYVELVSFTMINSHIDRAMKDLFRYQNLNTFVLKDVVIDEIDNNAININADATISGTTFPYLPGNAITIKGERISFVNNTFRKIQSFGLIIRSKEFKFTSNHVGEIGTQGLDVMGAKIEISKNVFTHLETGALQRISPGYSPDTYEIASKFIYNFSENIVNNINPGSLHPNWELFKGICSEIIFNNNLFDCSCTNIGWVSVSNGLGPKIAKVRDFYDTYLRKNNNACTDHKHCSLGQVIAAIQDVCNNKTNISTICTSADSIIDINTTTQDDSVMVNLFNSTPETTELLDVVTDLGAVTEKVIPVLSYIENQTSHMESRGIPIWFIVIPVIVVLAAASLGVFMWWYKKKKQRQIVTTMYKNERGADADSLIVINEHHNELYGKQ